MAAPADIEVVVRDSWEQVIESLDSVKAWRSLRIELLRALMGRIRLSSEMLENETSPDPNWPTRSNTKIEIREPLAQSVAALPTDQRDVVVLRDVSGLSATEVCDILSLAEPDQRRLLHRGRTTLRAVLHESFAGNGD